ncbi:MAG: 1,4-dihydroxy-2-naphthoate polyprenyltransferase [Actinobacteria bacterium]|nr:1,4-dihydroxy-2-naphthoate polyprenyltransferase [Actinomycetota bacterium]
MATFGQWVQGARPRTLPAAVAPVLVGAAAAWWLLGRFLTDPDREALSSAAAGLASSGGGWTVLVGTGAVSSYSSSGPVPLPPAADTPLAFAVRVLLALVVALALQIGVNYANDYSDGIRGTDEARVGPVRLVGQKLASPRSVKVAAFACFGVAALAGLALVVMTQAWWLLLVGAAAIVAAWFYTGGPSPYGYAGLGEVFVFVFFGLVAVMGTTYVLALQLTGLALAGGIACGSLSVAILLANNLRDIPTDAVSGKRTLAVRLGDARTRTGYIAALAVPFVVAGVLALTTTPWTLLALVALPLAAAPARTVRQGALGRDLVPVLAGTGRLLLVYAVLLAAGIVVGWSLAG